MNPLPKPGWVGELLAECADLATASRYPDPGLDALRDALSRLSGLRGWWVVPLNGSAEAPALAPLVYRPRAVAVVEPSFGDHALQSRVWPSRLVVVCAWGPRGFSLASQPPKGSMVVVGWPNNPTGAALPPSGMELLEEAAGEGGLLVVDEAFQPLSTLPHYVSRRAPQLTLWTPTKALGLPGLRLGAAASREWEVAEPIEAARQPWPVDSVTHCFYARLAESYLSEALRYVEEGRRLGVAWASWLSEALLAVGAEAHRSVTVYVLARAPGVADLARRLLSRGLYVRDASTFRCLGPGYVRLAAKHPREAIDLLKAIAAIRKPPAGSPLESR